MKLYKQIFLFLIFTLMICNITYASATSLPPDWECYDRIGMGQLYHNQSLIKERNAWEDKVDELKISDPKHVQCYFNEEKKDECIKCVDEALAKQQKEREASKIVSIFQLIGLIIGGLIFLSIPAVIIIKIVKEYKTKTDTKKWIFRTIAIVIIGLVICTILFFILAFLFSIMFSLHKNSF